MSSVIGLSPSSSRVKTPKPVDQFIMELLGGCRDLRPHHRIGRRRLLGRALVLFEQFARTQRRVRVMLGHHPISRSEIASKRRCHVDSIVPVQLD
jgi:hypothetical protein